MSFHTTVNHLADEDGEDGDAGVVQAVGDLLGVVVLLFNVPYVNSLVTDEV